MKSLREHERAWEFVFVVLLFAGAFVVRVWGMSRVHFWDEAVYLQNAEVICCGKLNYTELDSRPPLLSLIFAAVFKIWHSVYAADVVAALLNAAGPVLLYVAGRRVVGRIGAGIAALLLAFAPFFVGVFPENFHSDDTGNSLLADEPAVTLLLLGFLLLVSALRRQTFLRFAAAGFVFALAVLMRFSCLSTVAVIGILLFAAERWIRAAVACAIGFLVGLAPYLCWSRWRYGGFLTTLRNGWELYQGGRETIASYAQNFGNIFCWITLAGLVLWVARSIQSLRSGLRPPHAEDERLPRWIDEYLWAWALLVIAIFFLMPHQEPRYIMPAAPPLFLLAGSGLAMPLNSSVRAWRRTATIVVAAALLFTFLPDHERVEQPFIDHSESEEMKVAEYLDDNVPAGTIVYSNFNYPLFGFYSHLPVRRIREHGARLYARLEHLPADGILIAYKDPQVAPDPRPDWLAEHPQFQLFKEFESIALYHYQAGKK